MNDDLLVKIKEILTENLGEINFQEPKDVWDKISKFKNWSLPMPNRFAIAGRVVSSLGKQIVEFESLKMPKAQSISFSISKIFENEHEDDSYSFYLQYPKNLLVITASTFRPLSKVINIGTGAAYMSLNPDNSCPYCGSEQISKTGFGHGVGTGSTPPTNKLGYVCETCGNYFNLPR